MVTFKKGSFGKAVRHMMKDGKTFTIWASADEVMDDLIREFGKPKEVKASVWELDNGKLVAVGDKVVYFEEKLGWGTEGEDL